MPYIIGDPDVEEATTMDTDDREFDSPPRRRFRPTSAAVTGDIGRALLLGHVMLASHCSECNTVLMRDRAGEVYCVTCIRNGDAEQATTQPAAAAPPQPQHDAQRAILEDTERILAERRARRDQISDRISQYLVQGYTMLDRHCGVCLTVIVRERNGVDICAGCEIDAQAPRPTPTSQASDRILTQQPAQRDITLAPTNHSGGQPSVSPAMQQEDMVASDTRAGSQPVPDARHQQREGRAQRVAAAVGDALLKGHTMLNDHCRDCLTVLMKNGARTYCPGCELDAQQPSAQATEVADQPRAGDVQRHESGDAEMLETAAHTTGFVHTPVGDESMSRQASPLQSPQLKKLRLDDAPRQPSREGSQRFAWSADQSRRAAAACAGALEALTARLEDATNRLKDPTIGVGECIDLARLCRECCAAIAEMHSFS